MGKHDLNTPTPAVIMPPEFDESLLTQSFEKLRKLSNKLNTISLGHYGAYSDGDFKKIIDEMEPFYFKTKESIIKWYNENPDADYVTEKYQDHIIPNSKIFPKKNLGGIHWLIVQNIKTLKVAGFIK